MGVAKKMEPDNRSFISKRDGSVGVAEQVTVPTEVYAQGDDLRVRWLRCTKTTLRDPFFQSRQARLIEQALSGIVSDTAADALSGDFDTASCQPSGYIFHSSHCGSTLLAQILAAEPQHFVLIEPTAVVSLLNELARRPEDKADVGVVRALIQTLGRLGVPTNGRFFVKFFSHNIHHVRLLRLATPKVPEIFLYRNPVETLVANLKSPWQQWVWGERFTGLSTSEAVERPVVELFARGLGRNLQAMHDHLRDATLLMNYSEIGPRTPKVLLRHFGIPITDERLIRITAPMAYDAKDLTRIKIFQRDVETKRAAASPMLQELAARFAAKPFAQLEALREKRSSRSHAMVSPR